MNTENTSIPATGKPAIPQLFIRQGKLMVQVTAKQASMIQRAIRTRVLNHGLEPSRAPGFKLYNIEGKAIAHVSYNSRVWLGASHTGNNTELL